MRVLITGSTGFIGSALVPFLTAGGHEVVRVSRRPRPHLLERTIVWDPAAPPATPGDLEGFDAVVHLASENIGGGRWTVERKRRILESRVAGTRGLAEALARCVRPPGVLVSSSAIGIYGDRGDETLTEGSAQGGGFLAEVTNAWEDAAGPAVLAGIRLVHLRTGIVLGAAGGALARMLPFFRLGLGGPFGSGRQFMSWITIDDMIGLVLHAICSSSLAGPVNATAPEPVRNREFATALGRVLRRPAFLPLPLLAPALILGREAARALLFDSQRVLPSRALESGYRFRHPSLEGALRHLLGAESR